MCSGASSRGSLLWYRWTSEKWHASMFRKPDMTAGYLVSLLHRCTIALGKKRHQSYSSARRQRRIISGKVFTVSLEKKKNGSRAKQKCILGKAQKSLFCGEGSVPGLPWCRGRSCAGSRRGIPSPFSGSGNQPRSGTSSASLSPPAKQTFCNQRHGPCTSGREAGGVGGVQSTGGGWSPPAPHSQPDSCAPALAQVLRHRGEAKEPKGNLSPVPAPVKGWMNAACVLGPP